MNNYQDRKFGLDIVRAIAIISVLLCHNMVIFYSFVYGKLEVGFNYCVWAGGYYGVELFFVLSGFLIGSIFINKVIYPLQHNTKLTPYALIKDFWIRRWIRTLPNYYLFIGINLLLIPISRSKISYSIILDFLLFIQGFNDSGTSFFGVSWSLAVEEWFYLLMPIFFGLYILVYNKYKKYVYCFFPLLILPLIFKITLVCINPFLNDFEKIFHYRTMFKLDSIFYGLFLSWMWSVKGLKEKLLVNKNKLILLGLSGILFSIIYSFLFVVKPIQNPILLILYSPITSLSILLCFPFLIELKVVELRKYSWITRISLISYSLYLIHVPINIISEYFISLNGMQMNFNTAVMVFSLRIIISIWGANLLYNYFELPILKWRNRLNPIKV